MRQRIINTAFDRITTSYEYGEILDVPFVYSSNGDGFIEHDRITREERELELDEFPTREELFLV
ncbi:hypothetical protein [Streptococcus pneumoniae]|uniref:hypothetical protein n=1 Tax=Streptococcus pneumoniae TaxID=1313 RepID=UPI0021638D04|nr:hypothetical protein [Streptococcus pneumoniae]